MREVFQQELREVQDRLVEISTLVASSIERATESFNESNVTLAETVIADDQKIDALAAELDELAIQILARQNPVARDLRIVVSALRISASLERLVFEAPRKEQQLWMISNFGRNVNLGNVPLEEAVPLATLRTGLRADTFGEMHLAGVDVFLGMGVHGAIEARRRGGVVVLIDALRASATIVTALARGMAAVKPVGRPEECVGEITAGERGGRKLPNLRHGNSPLELMHCDYAGKTLVLTTTNGTECLLSAAGESSTVLVGTTLNRRAVASAALRLAQAQGQPVTLLMAGRNNQDAIEDALAAGEIARAMPGARLHGHLPSPGAALESDFFASDAGKNLQALGYADDVRFCAELDRFEVEPVFRDGLLVPLQ